MKLNDNVSTAISEHNGFDLSFDGVLSQTWGDIVPIVCKEMIPGDNFTCDASAFVRLAPLATPTYGRIHGYINYFFVPNRILCVDRGWEDFIRGGATGKVSYTLPCFDANALRAAFDSTSSDVAVWDSSKLRSIRKLFTYFGLPDPQNYHVGTPSASANDFYLSLLPFAAYNRIYGDYFYPWGIDESGDSTAEAIYFKRHPMTNRTFYDASYWDSTLGSDFFMTKRACFTKDYFTTAQLHPQRGLSSAVRGSIASSSNLVTVSPDNVEVSSSASTAITSLGMKWANALQKFLERNNVAGARYFEQILARFGVKIDAERLDRSEYLGGNDFYVNISDVTSTSSTSDASLGDMAGKAVGLGQGGVSYTSKDYGFFIATLHLMPESGIVQGLNRMWTRKDRTDFYTPEFEKETGMQPLYNCEAWSELYLDIANGFTKPSDTGVYGYVPRYSEYKYSSPLLAGDFRFKVEGDTSLVSFSDMDSMHLYRIFTSDDGNIPVLSPEFITLSNDGPFNRIFQDTNDDFDHFWTNIQVKLGANRPMAGYLEGSTAFVNDDKNMRVNLPSFGTRL